MLMLIYTVAAMLVTPFAYEYLNRRISESGRISHAVRSWPAYIINVIVCGVVGLIAMFLPGGWKVDFWNWIVLTALIYFGNQFVYQSVVKVWMRARHPSGA